MAEISDAIAMIKKAESDAEQLIIDSESQSKDLIAESKVNAEEIISQAKQAAEEEAKNTVFDAEDKATIEAESIAKKSDEDVAAIKNAAMANVDEAASVIVKNIL